MSEVTVGPDPGGERSLSSMLRTRRPTMQFEHPKEEEETRRERGQARAARREEKVVVSIPLSRLPAHQPADQFVLDTKMARVPLLSLARSAARGSMFVGR